MRSGNKYRRLYSGQPWTPLALGPLLYDMWDAERSSTLSLSGSAVTEWRSVKNGYAATQGVGAARPVYSATSFNGRPGVTSDGLDDELTYTGVGALPVGSSPAEVWLLADQTALVADTAVREVVGWGGASFDLHVRVRRVVSAGANAAQSQYGVGGSAVIVATTTGFSGRTVVRVVYDGSTTRVEVNGAAGTPSGSGTAAVGTSRFRIFAAPGTSAANFYQGILSFCAVTQPLGSADAARMLAFLRTRGGI